MGHITNFWLALKVIEPYSVGKGRKAQARKDCMSFQSSRAMKQPLSSFFSVVEKHLKFSGYSKRISEVPETYRT